MRTRKGLFAAMTLLAIAGLLGAGCRQADDRRGRGVAGGRFQPRRSPVAGTPAVPLTVHFLRDASAGTGETEVRGTITGADGCNAYGGQYAGGLTPPAWLEGPGTTVFDDMADLPELIRSV